MQLIRKVSLSLFVASGAILAFDANAAAVDAEAAAATVENVDCGSSDSGSGSYTTVGKHCTALTDPCSDAGSVAQARDDANANFVKDVKGGYQCVSGNCPAGQSCPTSGSLATVPSPPYAVSDCACTKRKNCDGNPAHYWAIVTCTASITFTYTCQACN